MTSSRHSFSGAATATTLSGGINSAVTTIPVNAISGTWPNTATGPFVVTIDRGTASEEKILVPSFSSTQFTGVTRGYDGTTAVSHSNGATVEHTLDATQIDAHDAIVYAVGTSTPSTSAVGDSAVDGTAVTTPAAGDHKHGRESFGTSATTSAVGDAQAAGTAATPSRSDHKHGRESFGASASNSAPGDVESAGSASTPSRSDHVHGRESKALLAVTQYAPGSVTHESANPPTHIAPIDSTNLKVTFTAPTSGNVLVRLSAFVRIAGACTRAGFALLDASNVKYGPTAPLNNQGSQDSVSVPIAVTGLTTGTSYTLL